MTPEERQARRAANQAFYRTPIGDAFNKMLNALGHAWVIDQRESSSDKSMIDAWQKSGEATAAFRLLLDELIAKAEKAERPCEPSPDNGR